MRSFHPNLRGLPKIGRGRNCQGVMPRSDSDGFAQFRRNGIKAFERELVREFLARVAVYAEDLFRLELFHHLE
jgi:hypothetical protein